MKNEISISEAKTKFFEINEKAKNGIDIIIEKRGVPLTVMMSYEKYEREKNNLKQKRLAILQEAKNKTLKLDKKTIVDSVAILRELRGYDT